QVSRRPYRHQDPTGRSAAVMSRILLADDDPAQLQLRRLVLESAGHEVGLELEPAGMLRQLGRGWDLLIMDLRFLNTNGIPDYREGLALIRQIRQTDTVVPVMVLSGWPDDLYGQPEEKMVTRVMIKPVRTTELLATIEELCPTGN